jgi:hypothetical protein
MTVDRRFRSQSQPTFFDVCKNRLNSKQNFSGISDIADAINFESTVEIVQYRARKAWHVFVISSKSGEYNQNLRNWLSESDSDHQKILAGCGFF